MERNIYKIGKELFVTNDEEIKEGDWHLKNDKMVTKSHLIDENCKKIILTTDQDLIKDGVQAIDVVFLEWFVKNPSCETVEVYELYGKLYAEPITQKEEPKQETLEEVAEHNYPIGDVWTEEQAVIRRLAFKNGANWQQQQDKKLYSEEDLHNAFYNGWIYRGDGYTFPKAKQEWFEQFKKK